MAAMRAVMSVIMISMLTVVRLSAMIVIENLVLGNEVEG